MNGTLDGLGWLAEPWLLVLTSGVRMEPGTLYGALSRLERRGWVRPLAAAGRRRSYEITAAWPGPAGRAFCPGRPRGRFA
jgi:hypothetical protein